LEVICDGGVDVDYRQMGCASSSVRWIAEGVV
jgi:hypothetical protein